jgi:hypothetical protein
MDDVLNAVQHDRPFEADVQQPLHPQHVVAASLQQHRQPDAEGRPVERLVEHEAERPRLVRWLVPDVVLEVARIALASAPEEIGGSDVAERRCDDRRDGIQPSELCDHGSRVGEVRLRDHERVRGRRLEHRLVVAESVLGIDGGDHALERVVVLHERLREQRVHDRRRVREPGRLDDDAPERRNLAGVAAGDQVAQLVGEIAAERAADTAARQQDGALVDAPQQVVVDPDLAELVHDHSGLAQVRMREEARQQRRLAAAEEPGDERDRSLHSDATSFGSSGSSVRPESLSASTQSEPRSPMTAERPFESRRTQTRPLQSSSFSP